MTEIIIYLILFVSAISSALAFMAYRAASQQVTKDYTVPLTAIETLLKQLDATTREEAKSLRDELRSILTLHNTQNETRFTAFVDTFEKRFSAFSLEQASHITAFRKETIEGREQLEQTLKRSSDTFSETQTKQLDTLNSVIRDHAESMQNAQRDARASQENSMLAVTKTIKDLIDTNSTKQDQLRETLTNNLDQLRKENEAKLEQMRLTVDEKLQGTLEKRIGESFQIVSDRLEAVQKGLGEMQNLATGVGDLKRVLTNVKSRGSWGEVQLAMLLEDMMTRDQYETNAKIRPSSSELVEFAIKLPGKNDNKSIFLPIDSKFPHEDYERLVKAQEKGDSVLILECETALQRAIKSQAKIISEKYVHPPYSTDFAIMYLPTEGLFAEVIRVPGLVKDIQNTLRVVITGPTTLAALLNSLQMGFKTLAIEKQSSEVWQVLGQAKAEFLKYGDVWDKLKRQLETAQNTVEEAGVRTRAVVKKLKSVEVLAISDSNTAALISDQSHDDSDEPEETEDATVK